ncbi:MAG: enoyl-CoA hydratase [Planctomycetes bacterium RBG_16_43_13]|nr:MAG: enoyl-CoA hydratase [Planctomycetes bacterium RBG_16_43_13]
MADYKFVKVSTDECVGIITISNPPVNALSSNVFREITDAINTFKGNPAMKAIVLTGAGTVFAAGADIKEILNIARAEDGEALCLNGHKVLNAIEQSDIPVIAAINGVAFGGGNELAISCHIRIASDKARFGQPEISIGIMPGLGGAVRLARLVGQAKATELALTGEPISAQDAKYLGLVNMVVPDSALMTQAVGLAKKIGSKGKVAIAYILKALREGSKVGLEDALKLEAKLFGQIMMTEDKKEGISAFLEKRQPKFKDR